MRTGDGDLLFRVVVLSRFTLRSANDYNVDQRVHRPTVNRHRCLWKSPVAIDPLILVLELKAYAYSKI